MTEVDAGAETGTLILCVYTYIINSTDPREQQEALQKSTTKKEGCLETTTDIKKTQGTI